MSRECYSIEELADLFEAGPDDPRSEHVRTCVQCRNLLESLRDFQAPARELPIAEVRHAEERMTAALERALSRTTSPARVGRRHARRTSSRAWTDWWRGPWWHPALGAAAVLVIIFSAVYLSEGPQAPGPNAVRGELEGADQILTLHAPELLPDGGLHLSWDTRAEVEVYQVVFCDLHLAELARFEATAASTLTLSPTDLDGVIPRGDEILWQVIALRRGVELARSQPAAFSLP